MSKGRILIIDDEEPLVRSLATFLKGEGYDVRGTTTGTEGLACSGKERFDVILCDLNLPDLNGMALLQKSKVLCPGAVFIMMTGYGSIEAAVKAMKEGAYDFICKPIQLEELLGVLDRVMERIRLIEENRMLRQAVAERYDFSHIIGKSKAIRDVLERITKVAEPKSTVLITGESGTGKELIARAIHYNSPRKAKPFVVVNCSAIPRELLESELFGHEKGAFTGALSRRKGLFEEADGGTLFLDEIGDLPPELQVKLLRAVQEEEIRRLGGTEPIKVDIRIIAATNRDLREEVETGRFRRDLYYRLNVVPIHVAPLRERQEDIPLLIEHFIKKYARKLERPVKKFTPAALDLLIKQNWLGNVRELENIIERTMIFSDDRNFIDVGDLPTSFQKDSEWVHTAMKSKLSIEEYTKALIQRYESDHTETELAALLGISPKTLWEKRKNWGLIRKTTQPRSFPYEK